MPLAGYKSHGLGRAAKVAVEFPFEAVLGKTRRTDLRVITPPLSQSLDPIGPHRVTRSDQEKINECPCPELVLLSQAGWVSRPPGASATVVVPAHRPR